MNRKGYTLIELIVVIALVSIIGTFGVVGLSKVIANSKNERYVEMIESLKSASNTYIAIYPEKEKKLYSDAVLIIPIADLQESLLIDKDLKNPKDNSLVTGCVKLTYSNKINYEVCPYESNCSCN